MVAALGGGGAAAWRVLHDAPPPSSVPAAAVAPAPPEPIHQSAFFHAAETTLANGLRVVVLPNHRAPVVMQMVWYRVGGADETQGKSGIAHFLEHLMFKGSEGLGPGEFSHKIRGMGGDDNAFTGHDYTAFHQSIAKDHLEDIMRMEAGRLRGLTLDPKDVDSERQVIIAERRQRIDNNPAARFGEQLKHALYVNHPYGVPVIGWLSEMEGLTRDDAKAYYDAHYGPNNAVLVIAGDVEPQEVFALAEKIYGPLKPIKRAPRMFTESPPQPYPVRMVAHEADVKQAEVEKLFRAPGYRKSKEESLALQVLQEIMGGGPTSRLYRTLVIERKLATDADLSYQANAWEDSEVTLSATLAPNAKPEEAEQALDDQLRLMVREGPQEQELRDAITRMKAAQIYALDSLEGPPMLFGAALITGVAIDDIEQWPENIGKITARDVQAVAAKYLNPDQPGMAAPVTGYLLPKDETAEVAP